MERMWTSEAAMKYPKQWIVMVNVDYNKETHKHMGDVYTVKPTFEEAFAMERKLGKSMGKSTVFEGFNDTPQIGGLELWSQ